MKRDIEWLIEKLRDLDYDCPGITVSDMAVTPMEECNWREVNASGWTKWEEVTITLHSSKRDEVMMHTIGKSVQVESDSGG